MDEGLLAIFERKMRRRYAHKTLRNYMSSLRLFTTWLHSEGMKLTAPSDADIDVYLAEREERGVSTVTTMGDYKALSVFYRWLHEVEHEIERNPMDKVTPPIVKEHPRYNATREDYEAMQQACDRLTKTNRVQGRRDSAIVALLWCGLRRGEICAIDVPGVNDIEGDVTIFHTKTGRVRGVTVVYEDMVDRVHRWLRVRPEGPSEALFVNLRRDKGQRLTPDGVTQVWNRARTHAGLPAGVTPQSFRRGQAAEMVDAGVDGALIMAHFGWTSERMKARYIREQAERLARDDIKRRRRK